MKIVNSIGEYYKFLKDPVFGFKKAEPVDFKSVMGLYFFTFFLVIIISGPIMSFLEVDKLDHALNDMLENTSKIQLFCLAVLFAPLVEELIFRLHLGFGMWKKTNFGYPFYATAMIFAFVHTTNFKLPSELWYYGPFLVVPQLILGLFLGYMRVRNGFFTGFFLHAFHNGIATLALFATPAIPH